LGGTFFSSEGGGGEEVEGWFGCPTLAFFEAGSYLREKKMSKGV
jgi:hypothetical protein